jgi:hypothetical protein
VFNTDVFSQGREVTVKPFAGIGSENNYGNHAQFAGISLSKVLYKRISLEGSLTYFTSGISNVYASEEAKRFDEEDRFFNAAFLTPALSFRLIGRNDSRFGTSIKVGPALKYYNYKLLEQVLVKSYEDGRREVVPGSLKYYQENGLNISAYMALELEAKLSKRLRGGLFLDTYSHEIPLEHTMLGLSVAFNLARTKKTGKVE